MIEARRLLWGVLGAVIEARRLLWGVLGAVIVRVPRVWGVAGYILSSMLRTFAVSLALSVVVVAFPANADVGPPDTSCSVDKRCAGKGVECRYVNSQPDAGDLQCAADAERRGLERVCSRGGGTVGVDIYCPKGTGTKSSGCAAAPGDAGMLGGAVVLALMVVANIRRRSRRGVERRR